jgi:hypothetical protein
MKISSELKSVLCDPEENASIVGSPADLETINQTLARLTTLENALNKLAKCYDPNRENVDYSYTMNPDDSFTEGYVQGANFVYGLLSRILGGAE